ncbi:hypothetical protein [Streptomyces griseoflavus]|uniref:hypothetical protein n=1 Tax=Streptomyces griseoflavus TaxID=35619 RepID=UPI00167EC1C3|nr:hypothetical protein [Streptomyces griseoflavus]GGV39034.1 hypothetical protein GCM10010293_43430 [Streptomyces griseoflavus]
MIPEISDKPRLRRPETGWARARRLRGKEPLRTCLPAVERAVPAPAPDTGPETNIVRGED